MKKIYLALSIMALSGVAMMSSAQVTVNPGAGSYPNLATAFAAINAGTHTGAITIDISASTVEPGVARLNPGFPTGAPATYTSVEIHVTAPNVVVEANATTVIELRGADNVDIDGHWNDISNPNPGSRDLTFRNTSTGLNNTCVWLTSSTIGGNNGANNNRIKNCNIEGVSALETAFGIVTGGSGLTVGSSAAFPNSNNRFVNNQVTKCNTGILLAGSPGGDPNGLVSDNIIGSMIPADAVGAHGISVANVTGLTISGNVIRGLNANSTVPVTGIDLGGFAIANTIVRNNRIHDVVNDDQTVGAGAVGIYMSPTNGNNNRIYNNQIHSVHSYGRDISQPFTGDNGSYGIAILTEGGYDVVHNTVYMNTGNANPGGGSSAALYVGAAVDAGGVTLMNNILSNTIQNTGEQYSVYSALGAVFDSIDYNLYNAPGDLSYMGAVATTLADWKTLSLRDTGSVSGNISLNLIADAVMVNTANSSSWLANGRALGMSGYTADINGTPRITLVGRPNDMGAAEFTPSVAPPIAVASGAPVAGLSTTYSVGNRKVAEILWGTAGTLPTSVDLQYYSGADALNFPPTDDRIQSYFYIDQTGGSGFEAKVTFYYTGAEDRGLAAALLSVMKEVTTGTWSNVGGVASIDPLGRLCGPNDDFMSTFGNFTLGNHPLAIDLVTFNGKSLGTANQLSWTTASEDRISGFDVLRSDDGKDFKVIGSVNATNNDMRNEYTFRDETPVAGANYYKLKIRDMDNGHQYSNVVALKNGGVTNIDITSLYPNPAMSTIAVALTSVNDATVNVQVTDIAGKTMITHNSAVKAGSNEVTLDLSGLASGIYMIKATLADGTISVQKFVKQ